MKDKKEYKINKSFLSSGKDLKLANKIYVKHPTVQEILDIDDSIYSSKIYWNMVALLTCDPYDNMVMLDDIGLDYEECDSFDVFCIQWDNFYKKYNENKEMFDKLNFHPIDQIKQALCFFLGNHDFDISIIENVVDNKTIKDKVLTDRNLIYNDESVGATCSYMIDRHMFNYLSEFISCINVIDKSQRINPADKNAKRILIEDKRDEIERLKHNQNLDENSLDDYIGKTMDGISWGGNGGINVFNVKQLKIYDLFTGFNIINRKNHSDHVLNGVYFGTVNPKDLKENEIDWVK